MLRYRIYIHWHTLIITNKIKVHFLPFLAFIIFLYLIKIGLILIGTNLLSPIV